MSNSDNDIKGLIKSALLDLNNTDTHLKIVKDQINQTIAILNDCIEVIEDDKKKDEKKLSVYTENFFDRLEDVIREGYALNYFN